MRALRWLLVAVAFAATLLLVAYRVIDRAVTDSYSSEWTAASSAEAAREGRLRARPRVTTPVLDVAGHRFRIEDAWVEQAYHVEYRGLFARTTVLDPRYRVLMRLVAEDSAAARGPLSALGDAGWPRYNDEGKFTTTTGALWYGDIRPPFPETLQVRFPTRRGTARASQP